MTDRKTRLSPLVLSLLLALPFASPAPAADGEATVILRPAAPPSAIEQARFERWYRAWREETATFRPTFAAAVRAAAGSDRELRPHCEPLAASVLGVDRDRVLPAPEPAADLHLRRALRAVTLAAVSCLRGRPYAARGRLRTAGDEFRRVERLLRRYRRPGAPRDEREAGVVIAPRKDGTPGDGPKGDP